MSRMIDAVKLSGAAVMQVKSRPRIPTPDVTKEVVDRENRLAANVANMQNQMSTGLTLMPHQLPTNYTSDSSPDIPVVHVVLSPIQELDGSGSVNNTLHANQPGTAALAQAVLSPGLGPILTTPVSVPMTVSQLTSLGLSSHHGSPHLNRNFEHVTDRNPAFIKAFEQQMPLTPTQPLTLTELHPEDEQPLSTTSSNNGSAASEASHASKDSIISNMSNTTASVTSKRSLEIPIDVTADTQDPTSMTVLPNLVEEQSTDMGNSVSIEIPMLERTSSFIAADIGSVTPSASAPNSVVSLNGGITDGARARKVSAVSQNTGNNSPKREVYV